MTLVTSHSMVDNLEETALALHDLILDPSNQTFITECLTLAENENKGLVDSWIYGWFNKDNRKKGEEITSIKALVNKINEPIAKLDAISHFFQKGKWHATSLNTVLMHKLIRKLPHYHDQDILLYFTVEITERLNKLFLAKAVLTVQAYKALEQEKIMKAAEERQKELASLSNVKVAKKQQQLLATMNDRDRFKKYKPDVIPKLSDAHKKNIAAIDNILKGKLNLSLTPSATSVKKLGHNPELNQSLQSMQTFFKAKERDLIFEKAAHKNRVTTPPKPFDPMDDEVLERTTRLNLFFVQQLKKRDEDKVSTAPQPK